MVSSRDTATQKSCVVAIMWLGLFFELPIFNPYLHLKAPGTTSLSNLNLLFGTSTQFAVHVSPLNTTPLSRAAVI